MQVSEVNVWRHYTVKAGERLILKSVAVTNRDVQASTRFHVMLNGFYVYAFLLQEPYATRSFDLLAVGYEGEQIEALIEGAYGHMVLTGWVLKDPEGQSAGAETLPGYTPPPLPDTLPPRARA